MTSSKFKSIALLVVLIVAVTVATTFATNYFITKQNSDDFASSASQLRNKYARFANLPNGGDTDFTQAADLTVHAVVNITIKGKQRTMQMQSPFGDNDDLFKYFFGPQQRQPQQRQQQKSQDDKLVPLGTGSGVIISSDGYIVTNNHVVSEADEIDVTLNNKHTYKAKIIGRDPNTDLALIKIDAKDLPTIAFGNSDDLKVGQWVLAVGNPFNLTSTVTAGIVSAKARNIGIIGSNGQGNMPIESFIQTDAAINPGNSGGALVNTKGELVGINAAIASQTGSYAGYGFAIPVNLVKKVVTDLRDHGAVQRAILGVQIANLDAQADEVKKMIKDHNIKTFDGALVVDIVEKGAAEKAGVKKGDVITEVNNVKVNSSTELQEQIGLQKPGDKVKLNIIRDGKPMEITVELKNAEGNTKLVTASGNFDSLGGKYKPIDEKIEKSLGIDYGLQITSLSKGKLTDQGVKAGFIILKINDEEINSEDDLKNAFNEAIQSDQKVLFIAGVYPNGKITYYAINLAD